MFQSSISEYKDTDKLILKCLDEESLYNCLSLNKYFYNLCDNDFFMNIMIFRYNEVTHYKKSNITWKKYYLQTIKYIELLRLEFNYRYTRKDKNPEFLYKVRKLYADKEPGRVFSKIKAIRYCIFTKNLQLTAYFTDFIQPDQLPRLLIYAVETDCFALVKYFVEKAIQINVMLDTSGTNSLSLACKNNNFGIVKYLLENKADPNLNHAYALTICFVNGYFRLFILLIDYGAIFNINIINNVDHAFPNINVNLDVLKYLHYNHFNVHINNYRLLKEALKCGDIICMEYLIEKGADFNSRRCFDFLYACGRADLNLVKYLVSLGVSKYEVEEAISYTYYQKLFEISDYLRVIYSKRKFLH